MRLDTKFSLNDIKATLLLAWPIILSNLSQMAINATDVILLGKVGPEALAASTIGVALVMAPLVIGIGILSASSAIIAKELGAKAHSVRMVRKTVHASMFFCFIYCIPIMALLYFSGDILKLSGLEPNLAANIGLFIKFLMFQLPSALITIAFRNFFNALHRPIWGLNIAILSVFVNGILNYGLILGHFGLPKLGLVGAGIGSSLTCLFSMIAMILVIIFERNFRRYFIFSKFWEIDFGQVKNLLKLGTPIGFQLGFEVGVFTAAAILMGFISTDAAAAHAIAIQTASITFMVPMGIAQAATIRVSNAYGRNNRNEIANAGWSAFYIAMTFMVLMAILMWIFPYNIAALFVDKKLAQNQNVILIAIGLIKIAAIFQIADGAQVVGAGMLRGLHDTKWPMIFAGIGYWGIGVGVGALLAFKMGMEGNGIWLGLALGLGIVGTLMIGRFALRERLKIGVLPTPLQ